MPCSHLKKPSEYTTIKNTISIDNIFKYIYIDQCSQEQVHPAKKTQCIILSISL